MPQPKSRLRVREEGDVLLVSLVDRSILDETTVQEIGDEIGKLIDAQPQPRFVVSFAEVEHLSSPSLGALIALHNKIRGKNGQLRLADMSPKIHQIFVVTQLDTLFAIHPTSEEAVAGMA